MGLFNFFTKKSESGQSQVQNQFDGEQGVFIDPRDNNHYRWLKIDNMLWMIDNLKYHGINGVVAYDNKKNIVEDFGFLYTRKAAIDYCPEGWNVPTNNDFNSLLEENGYHELFDEGFLNFKLGGRLWDDGESRKFTSINSIAYYWSSTIDGSDVFYLQVFGPSSVKINYTWDNHLKEKMGCSVRCVKYLN